MAKDRRRGERESDLAALLRVADIWSRWWQRCRKASSTESEEEWLALTPFTQERRGWWSWRTIQMSVSGQVSHLSRGAGQVTLSPTCRKSGGRLVTTSHDGLGAVLPMWPIPNSRLPCIGVERTWRRTSRAVLFERCLTGVEYGKLSLLVLLL